MYMGPQILAESRGEPTSTTSGSVSGGSETQDEQREEVQPESEIQEPGGIKTQDGQGKEPEAESAIQEPGRTKDLTDEQSQQKEMALTEEMTEVPESGGSEESEDGEILMAGGQQERDEQRRNQWEEKEKSRKLYNKTERKLRERIPLEMIRIGRNDAKHSKFADGKARYVQIETEETSCKNYIYESECNILKVPNTYDTNKAAMSYLGMIEGFYMEGMLRTKFNWAIQHLIHKCAHAVKFTEDVNKGRTQGTDLEPWTRRTLFWYLMLMNLVLEHLIQIDDARRLEEGCPKGETRVDELIKEAGIAIKNLEHGLLARGVVKVAFKNVRKQCKSVCVYVSQFI